MSSGTFAAFPRLPTELRIAIWNHAIPISRVILVQEAPLTDEYPDPEAEAEYYRDLENFLTLRKEKAKPAPDWAHYLAYEWRLPYVNYSGCTWRGTGHDYYKWRAHKYGLPAHFCSICEREDQATRRGRLFTRHPVLPLLQACQESRQLMQEFGYVLTFSSRCAPPLTWFNFENDILYLRQGMIHSRGLDKTSWNLAQFKQTDLARVKRLALSVSSGLDLWNELQSFHAVVTASQFQDLEELLIVVKDVVGLGHIGPEENRDPVIAIECELSHPPDDVPLRDLVPFAWWYDIYLRREFWEQPAPPLFKYFPALVEDFELALRAFETCRKNPDMEMKIPKIRFVVMAAEDGKSKMLEWKRERYDGSWRRLEASEGDLISTKERKRRIEDPELGRCCCPNSNCCCGLGMDVQSQDEIGVIIACGRTL